MRRGAIVVLALFYAVQSSWLLQGGADLLFPRAAQTKQTVASCCNSGCGCPAEKQERRRCCCYPDAPDAAPAPSSPGSVLEEARCSGPQEAVVQALAQPALVPGVFCFTLSLADRLQALPEIRPADAPPEAPPDKVPL